MTKTIVELETIEKIVAERNRYKTALESIVSVAKEFLNPPPNPVPPISDEPKHYE